MQDEPTPHELLAAVASWMRNELMPVAPADKAFHVRVAANAIDLALRQLQLEPASSAAELARLQALQLPGSNPAADVDAPAASDDPRTGLAQLNAMLAQCIASGAIAGDEPKVIAHLYATTLEKLAVDQPGYAAFRRALEGGGPA